MPDIGDELVSRLVEIRQAADRQLDRELEKLTACLANHLHAEEARGLVDAALQLRSLDEGTRLMDLRMVLSTLDGSANRYSMLMDIADAENFTTVSSALSELVSMAFYDILDDGILNLIRVECSEHFVHDEFPEETKFVRYYLTSNEWFGRKGEIEGRILDTNAGMTDLGVVKVKIVGMKRMWFGEVGKFAEFLKILANEENYDALYNNNLAAAIDGLMRPETYEDWEED